MYVVVRVTLTVEGLVQERGCFQNVLIDPFGVESESLGSCEQAGAAQLKLTTKPFHQT